MQSVNNFNSCLLSQRNCVSKIRSKEVTQKIGFARWRNRDQQDCAMLVYGLGQFAGKAGLAIEG